MKRIALLTIAAALVAAAAVLPGQARAAAPCRDRIYNEWYASGKISTNYPIACYKDALKHIPSDARVYSNLGTDIKDALQAAKLRKTEPNRVPAAVGSGKIAVSDLSGHATKGAQVTNPTGPSALRHHHPAGPAVASGPVSDGGGSSGLPLPIIVLGGVAIALAAAGAIGAGARHFRHRG